MQGLFALFEKHTGVKAPTMTLPYTLLPFAASMIYRLSGRTNTTLDPVRAEMGSVFWVRECRHDFLLRCSASNLLRAMPPNLLPALAPRTSIHRWPRQKLGFEPRDHEETVKDTIKYVGKHHPHPK